MCFRCHDFRRVAVMSAVLAVAACSREDRDFQRGGPRLGYIARKGTAAAPVPSFPRGPHSTMESNAFALSEGKRLYSSFNCVGCHSNGGGDIGPALMDAKWLYGANPEEVYASIMAGRPNGMPAYRGRITETQARQLAAYVRSLSGQAASDAAPSRDDHLKSSAAENSLDRETPALDRKPRL
jgi:cytochrome c oxidase cbb3-type subunit 3